ncbi:MAG: glycosyltransferase family 9 protein [Bacteroidales bacterium]|nr:glycosyltransferase family 9 protein [Bacteroidales bacterium]
MAKVKHILVVRLSALGDVALLAPVVLAFAEANPEVHFTVAAPPMLAPLFGGKGNLDFIGVSKKQPARAIYRQLRAVGADAVADMHVVNRVGRALRLLALDELLKCHLHFRIIRLRKGRWSRWLMTHGYSRSPRRPQCERYADVFRRLRLAEGHFLPEGEYHGEQGGAIGIAPFAQHQGKIWPLDRTERLVAMLAGRGHRVVLFGSKDEAHKLDHWAQLYPRVVSVAGKLKFDEELDVMRHLSLMVSMDSANMHFASAIGLPVVSIWGATHPDFGFYGLGQARGNALCADLPCQPCSAYGNRKCRYGDHHCLQAITPEAVLARIEETLAQG